MRMTSSILKIVTISAAGAALFACGTSNDTSSSLMVDSSGKHAAGWVQRHSSIAKTESYRCAECHGSDYLGGISRVSCMGSSSADRNGDIYRCHVTSPIANPTGCVSCHGGTNGPYGVDAPNRQFAHTAHVAAGCTTCHPDSGHGTVTSHARAAVDGGYKRATLNITGYQAQTPGTAATVAQGGVTNGDVTCSNVSCHGGKITPAWSGTIQFTLGDSTACFQCHAPFSVGAPQYNSFFSGKHSKHLNSAAMDIVCSDCHDYNALVDFQKHFSRLAANSFKDPGATVGGANTKVGTYNKTDKSCSSIVCHPPLSW